MCVLGQSGPCGPVHLAPICPQRQEAASQYRKGDTVFTHRENRLRSRGASYRLEPDDMKVSRPVLRGGGGGNATSSPDQACKGWSGPGKEVSRGWGPYLVPGIEAHNPTDQAIQTTIAANADAGTKVKVQRVELPAGSSTMLFVEPN